MIIKYNTKELDLLARIMRAEAIGEGNLGMLMVGNVVINRALADCLTFKNVTTILTFVTINSCKQQTPLLHLSNQDVIHICNDLQM